jgi:S-adenosyl-L-methionine hydrolase (adenosine-forming)
MPLITLTTDFGLADHYVAAMKAVILRHCPDAAIVDISHLVPPQDILAGSFLLERAVYAFEPATIHVAVVDPGVGTDRPLIAVNIRDRLILCPDNGLPTWAWRRWGPGGVAEIVWRPQSSSDTFHGRDVLAPVAARVAAGEPLDSFTRPTDHLLLLPIAPAKNLKDARVIHIDAYGNAITNVPAELAGAVVGLVRTYADVPVGQQLKLINSSGLLEIAIRDGSAAKRLKIKVGQAIKLK